MGHKCLDGRSVGGDRPLPLQLDVPEQLCAVSLIAKQDNNSWQRVHRAVCPRVRAYLGPAPQKLVSSFWVVLLPQPSSTSN